MPRVNQPGPSIRTAIVEDLQEDRELLSCLIGAAPGFSCVAVCRSVHDAVQSLPERLPDVVLMDIRMPGTTGIEGVRLLKPRLPSAQFMLLTALEDHDLIFRSLQAGATGYVLKKTPPAKLLEAIKELHEGGSPMSGQIARKVVAHFQNPAPASANKALSPMEEIVLEKLGRGLLYKEVAAELQLSVATVRTHICHIYEKLHVSNRTEAIRKGLRPRTRNEAQAVWPRLP
jgi:DNA-binding NarL/FixJ family response regulator